jgi:hypothetical protein
VARAPPVPPAHPKKKIIEDGALVRVERAALMLRGFRDDFLMM